jgi:hypothetical protein
MKVEYNSSEEYDGYIKFYQQTIIKRKDGNK